MLLSTSDEIVFKLSNQETWSGFVTLPEDTQTLILKNRHLFHILNLQTSLLAFT